MPRHSSEREVIFQRIPFYQILSQILLRAQVWQINPDYAVAEFAEDARRRVRRRTLVLQVPDNKANSVKSATPCGFKCRKNISKISFTFWVKDLNTFVKYNRPILKIKFPFSVFEVHNSGLNLPIKLFRLHSYTLMLQKMNLDAPARN